MPFADYGSMDECERAHSDKNDPGAYCAQIHYNATGEWPGEKTASDFYSDADTYIKHALDAMEEVGVEPTDEKLAEVEETARGLAA